MWNLIKKVGGIFLGGVSGNAEKYKAVAEIARSKSLSWSFAIVIILFVAISVILSSNWLTYILNLNIEFVRRDLWHTLQIILLSMLGVGGTTIAALTKNRYKAAEKLIEDQDEYKRNRLLKHVTRKSNSKGAKLLILSRSPSKKSKKTGILGELFYRDDNGGIKKISDTFELPWLANRRSKSCISDGTYRLVRVNAADGSTLKYELYIHTSDLDEERASIGFHGTDYSKPCIGQVTGSIAVCTSGYESKFSLLHSRKHYFSKPETTNGVSSLLSVVDGKGSDNWYITIKGGNTDS